MLNVLYGMLMIMSVTACAHTTNDGVQSPLTNPPLVIAHRGASGILPEHTLPAYEKAIEMGADYIELDLVASKDGVLFVRHENEISGTTDVARKFPNRRQTKRIEGVSHTGWFTEDFTSAELRTLRANERLPGRPQGNTGKFPVPTVTDVFQFVKEQEKKHGREIGIYIEVKHPSYFVSIGLALEPKLVSALNEAGLNREGAKVFLQCFETKSLREFAAQTKLPTVFLYEDRGGRPYDLVLAGDRRTYGDFLTESGLAEVATFAKGIGPWKNIVTAEVVRRAHAQGLVVHPYTFRSDAIADPVAEYEKFFRMGVDGVFTDFPDHALKARAEFFGK